MKEHCRVMTDATLIEADASLIHSSTTTLTGQQEAEAQRQRRGMIDGQAQRTLSNQTHRSRTDPDATLAQKQGTPRQLKYKVHQTIDADSRIILDTEVTTGGSTTTNPILSNSTRGRSVRHHHCGGNCRPRLWICRDHQGAEGTREPSPISRFGIDAVEEIPGRRLDWSTNGT